MAHLSTHLLDPRERPAVVADACALVDRELTRTSGLSGMALRAAHRVVVGIRPGMVPHAVDALLDHLQADRADTIAFGDASVDIPMFQACAVGVAMGNASDDLKALATLVTGDVEADGLADAFRDLGLAADATPTVVSPD